MTLLILQVRLHFFANALVENGAKEVYACCTHPVLSGPAVERINNSTIKELVVTNSIKLPEEKKIERFKRLSVGPLLAEAIIRVHGGNQSAICSAKPFFEV